jgi:hypothetical protein
MPLALNSHLAFVKMLSMPEPPDSGANSKPCSRFTLVGSWKAAPESQ